MRRHQITLARMREMARIARTAAPMTPRQVRAHLRRVEAQRARDEARRAEGGQA